MTEVTYLGYVYGTLAAVRRMRQRNHGAIVQIGSALAYRSIPLQSAYCAAKHAIQGFTDSLRSELIHDGSDIHITTLQLPAVNTPQFSWIKCRMPRHPQPVPPIFQPEVIARAAYWAAHHRRRELWIGSSAVKAIIGQKFIPGLLDHYLAWIGYGAQQTDEPLGPNRPNNLHSPLPGDYGAHGAFDRRARSFSVQSWMNMKRDWLGLAGFGAVAWYLMARWQRRQIFDDHQPHQARSRQDGMRRPIPLRGNSSAYVEPQVFYPLVSLLAAVGFPPLPLHGEIQGRRPWAGRNAHKRPPDRRGKPRPRHRDEERQCVLRRSIGRQRADDVQSRPWSLLHDCRYLNGYELTITGRRPLRSPPQPRKGPSGFLP